MLIKSVHLDDFQKAFKDSGRETQFSPDALSALFDYYNEFEEKIELDVIAICCEWTEYGSKDEALAEYGFDDTYDLTDFTQVIELDEQGILAANF